MATVRYLVLDVGDSIDFYVDVLGFELIERFGPAMAIVRRDDLSLWLAGPISSAAKPMPDGRRPEPGGWARIVIETENLAERVETFRVAGVVFRSDLVQGPGGSQILMEDPSGNVVELFQPA